MESRAHQTAQTGTEKHPPKRPKFSRRRHSRSLGHAGIRSVQPTSEIGTTRFEGSEAWGQTGVIDAFRTCLCVINPSMIFGLDCGVDG